MPFSYITSRSRWEPLTSSAWTDFHSQWWGEAGEARLDRARACRLVRVKERKVCTALHLLTDTAGALYLRDEILRAYQQISLAFTQESDGVVCAGSPACGKSSALVYVLLCRMAAQCPVIFSSTTGTSFFFDSKGVWSHESNDLRRWPHVEDMGDNPSDRFWSLIDYDVDWPSAPNCNLMQPWTLFPVHAVRYHERQQYNYWANHCISHFLLIMDPCSAADLVHCLDLQPRFSRFTDGGDPTATLALVTNAMNRSGPNVLDVLRELEHPGFVQTTIESTLRTVEMDDEDDRAPQGRRRQVSIQRANGLAPTRRRTRRSRPPEVPISPAARSSARLRRRPYGPLRPRLVSLSPQ